MEKSESGCAYTRMRGRSIHTGSHQVSPSYKKSHPHFCSVAPHKPKSLLEIPHRPTQPSFLLLGVWVCIYMALKYHWVHDHAHGVCSDAIPTLRRRNEGATRKNGVIVSESYNWLAAVQFWWQKSFRLHRTKNITLLRLFIKSLNVILLDVLSWQGGNKHTSSLLVLPIRNNIFQPPIILPLQ
jgi:hypothetical protein